MTRQATKKAIDWIRHNYRRKPEPLRCWVNVYPCGPILGSIHGSEQEAREHAEEGASRVAVPMVEVTE